ncbi:uncharacterized protein LOC143039332 [Oratosquilla oratoria]|uniref:uncharacterized protein LOC143039332 n=1 Tax=Oratosquilla oratoria TaxID=337810 RepID=UPI003F76F3A1
MPLFNNTELRILQWKINGFHLKGFDTTRGCMALVKDSLPCSEDTNAIYCGDGVETHAALIQQGHETFTMYNLYRGRHAVLDLGATGYNPTSCDVDSLEADFSVALHAAASAAIPLQGQPTRGHKNHWHYNEEMREANHRVCMFRRGFRRNRTQITLANLREAIREAHATVTCVRINKFHEWCEGFNTHTSLSELWRKLHVVTNRSCPRLNHHVPVEEAQWLVEEFASRISSAFLPQRTQETQQQLREGRIHYVGDMMAQPDETDTEFTLGELTAARRPGKNIAPGEDRVTYSMLAHLGPAGGEAFLRVVSASWRTGRLPTAWKTATIVPIPKPKEPGAYRPISLVSCMGKMAERMILSRLLWKLGLLHEHIYAYRKGTGAAHSIATLLAAVSNEPSITIFLDLEKAFELASPLAIQDTLDRKGVRSRLPRSHVGVQGAGE